ncbi:MAG TPA: CbiX/SirB N-terminal domain-containing protein, partial [Lacipirellulaceae bacterium]|nr:CbiX/SirB N-terminal domain-containing protein [Lacipirellulaceae bacterium]
FWKFCEHFAIPHGLLPLAVSAAAPNAAARYNGRVMPAQPPTVAIILVDHGSRRAESTDQLLAVVDASRQHASQGVVEPAHMELAEPSIATAFARCVAQGASQVIVVPYFLAPGKHWNEDIPQLTATAAAQHPGVAFAVAPPLGLHPLMLQVIDERVAEALGR